jgi:hypothetical protein
LPRGSPNPATLQLFVAFRIFALRRAKRRRFVCSINSRANGKVDPRKHGVARLRKKCFANADNVKKLCGMYLFFFRDGRSLNPVDPEALCIGDA